VRTPTGACIEEDNCNWELATVCAFSNATMVDKVNFLACMDDAKSAVALTAAESCAAGSIKFDAVKACYNDDQGKSLLEAASKVWNKAFPARATVPHTFVAGTDVQASYAPLKAALCKAGSTATVCKSVVTECMA